MKKTFLTVLMAVMLVALVGCNDAKPGDWNVEAVGSTWEVWGKGTIVSIKDIVEDKCDNGVGCSNHWTVEYKFDTGKTIYLRHVRNPGSIIEGQTGKLYRNMSIAEEDKYAWFQWIEDFDSKTSPAKKEVIVTKVIEKPNALNINIVDNNKSVWVDSSQRKPDRYKTVAIKFTNETVSLGYINNVNAWKLSINKLEAKGGESISNQDIIQWKEVDLR